MSYESEMLENLNMPPQKEVEKAILESLFKHNGIIKEFGTNEIIVDEIANIFSLNRDQRDAYLITTYKKENREKKSYLWHRLLFRAADSLAKEKLVTRPTKTFLLTNKREWMLTEAGYSRILEEFHIPLIQKEFLPVKSFEVQKIVEKIFQQERREDYIPFDTTSRIVKITQETKLRDRAFRQAIIEAYDYKCAVCGMKIFSPHNNLHWEVEAAHIVPHKLKGKDDILNGLALCRLHHWAFDVGWFSLEDNFKIIASSQIQDLSTEFGNMGNYNFLKHLYNSDQKISLPVEKGIYPHVNAIRWHRENIFFYNGVL